MTGKKENDPACVWYTPKQLSDIYGFSISRQATLRSAGMIPFHRIHLHQVQ